MDFYKTYKFKLDLSQVQKKWIDNSINGCRFIYNLAKETKEWAYKSNKVIISNFDLNKQLTDLKKDATWLYQIPHQCLQNTIIRLGKSYNKFFNGCGYPRWAKRGKYNSIIFDKNIIIKNNKIRLSKIGWLKFFKSQEMGGEIRQVIIKKEINDFFVNIITKQGISDLPYSCESQAEIGLDMGVSFFCVTSDGEFIKNPRFLEQNLKRLRIEQRSLSRKKKGSKNREKQKIKVAKLHQKIRRRREDFLHKISTRLVLDNKLISIEDLSIDGLLQGNVSRKISDVSWGEFFRQLDYKTDWYGGELIEINPAYTSQTCSKCGFVSKENRKSQSKFKCVECGHEENADLNASKNILRVGQSQISREREAIVCA